MTRPVRFEYRRPGKGVSHFTQHLVLDRPDVKVLLTESYEGESLHVRDRVILEPGAPIVWYVFPEKWHDIGRFHLADKAFTGWYTNLTTPVEIAAEVWRANDLFLDLWQPADGGTHEWLDADELAEAARRNIIDATTRRRVENERAMLAFQLERGEWPPAVARDVDLAQVLRLLQA